MFLPDLSHKMTLVAILCGLALLAFHALVNSLCNWAWNMKYDWSNRKATDQSWVYRWPYMFGEGISHCLQEFVIKPNDMHWLWGASQCCSDLWKMHTNWANHASGDSFCNRTSSGAMPFSLLMWLSHGILLWWVMRSFYLRENFLR